MNVFDEGLAWQPLIGWPWLLVAVGLLVGVATASLIAAGSRPERLDAARRLGMVVVLGLIGFGPSSTTTTVETTAVAADVFFVVDRTGSMAAEDWGADGEAPRLDGVRHDVVALTRAIPGARYSIIGFDSIATRQLPLTWDARAVHAWAQTVRQEITAYSKGSLLDRPLNELAAALQASAESHPQNVRVVYFLSDGEETVPGERRSFADLAPLIDGGAVLGYGTEAGGPMREYVPGQDETDYIQDPAGGDGISVIDEAALQEIADELGVPYGLRSLPDEVTSLATDVNAQLVVTETEREVAAHRPVVWPLALLLAVLLGWEVAVRAAGAGRSSGVWRA
ncbi:vWA domain-containing protein [Nocardioides limicola]|uniref:vWA domain-containing protein n=1 Tax=Nocardioides limicola TaxID=2803368 RepID=UPI00193B0663|nr:vWA domain-containing protein [Nocardioides sp. DJM-14]